MELNKYTVALVSLAALSSPLSFADNNQTNILLDKATHTDQVASISNQKDMELPKESVKEDDVGYFSRGSVLPIFGDMAREKGYTLPEPFGIGYNYMDIRQNIKVSTIALSGLGIGDINFPANAFDIKVGKTRERSKTSTARLDTWLFPFMNIYGIVGHTHGSSLSKIDVNGFRLGDLELPITNLKNLDFELKFKGTTYGGGTTFVGGYHDAFASLDLNYTRTNFNILDGNISALTVTPRIGYRITVPAVSKLYIPEGHVNLWVGTMYQDIQQEFKGNISDLHFPVAMQEMVHMANEKGQGRFRVKQHLKSPWNMLVGAQYEITKNFNITTEVGFEKRNSFMLAGEVRF